MRRDEPIPPLEPCDFKNDDNCPIHGDCTCQTQILFNGKPAKIDNPSCALHGYDIEDQSDGTVIRRHTGSHTGSWNAARCEYERIWGDGARTEGAT